jgi:hypothetical protein
MSQTNSTACSGLTVVAWKPTRMLNVDTAERAIEDGPTWLAAMLTQYALASSQRTHGRTAQLLARARELDRAAR